MNRSVALQKILSSAIVVTLLLFISPISFAGVRDGGGGDSYSQEFAKIGHDVVEWLKSAPGSATSTKVDWVALKKAVETTRVESTTDALILNGVLKDAINYPSEHRIIFNKASWDRLDIYRKKAALVFHEYLGIAGVDDSAFQVSQVLLGLGRLDLKAGAMGSTTYQQLVINNDGSVTVVRPYFQTETGDMLPIFSESAVAACRRYGLGAYVAQTTDLDSSSSSAILDSNGTFSGRHESNTNCRLTGYPCPVDNGPITTVTCSPFNGINSIEIPSVADRAESVSVDKDGNFIIVRPFVLREDGKKIPVEARPPSFFATLGPLWNNPQQDINSVCQYFGFYQAVSVVLSEKHSGDTAFILYGKLDTWSGGSSIDSVVCRN